MFILACEVYKVFHFLVKNPEAKEDGAFDNVIIITVIVFVIVINFVITLSHCYQAFMESFIHISKHSS